MEAPKALRGVTRGPHHVAIAVPKLAEARAIYETALGMRAMPIEFVPGQKVNVLVLFSDTQRIELVEPAAEDSPITNFLAKRGPGIHHLAWRVEDCAQAIATLEKAGLQLIDKAPKPGSHGTKVA
jgi:methylmalonyl-CoA epimerase